CPLVDLLLEAARFQQRSYLILHFGQRRDRQTALAALLAPGAAVVRLDLIAGNENHPREALLDVALDLQLTFDQCTDFIDGALRPLQCRIELLWRRKTLLNLQQPRLDGILRNILGAKPLHVSKAERLSDQGIENEPAVVVFAL